MWLLPAHFGVSSSWKGPPEHGQVVLSKVASRVDVEEVLTATLPNKPVSSDEELDVLSNPLLASPPGKEVKKKRSSHLIRRWTSLRLPIRPLCHGRRRRERRLCQVPPPPLPQKKVKGKKALPSAPPKVKGKKALPSAPPADPPTSKRLTQKTIPSETTPLGVGDWLTDKDILCWLKQELCHMEIDEPHSWTLAVLYIKGLSRCMRIVEFGITLDYMSWCRRHIFVLNTDDKERAH